MSITRAKIERTEHSAYAIIDDNKYVIMNVSELSPDAEDAIVSYEEDGMSAFIESRSGTHVVRQGSVNKLQRLIRTYRGLSSDDFCVGWLDICPTYKDKEYKDFFKAFKEAPEEFHVALHKAIKESWNPEEVGKVMSCLVDVLIRIGDLFRKVK